MRQFMPHGAPPRDDDVSPAVLAIRRRRRRRAADALPVRLRHRRVRLARFVSQPPDASPPRSPPATRDRPRRALPGAPGDSASGVLAPLSVHAPPFLCPPRRLRVRRRGIGNAEIHHHVTPLAVFATAGEEPRGFITRGGEFDRPPNKLPRSRSRRNGVNSCACPRRNASLPAKEGTRVHTARSSW